MVCMKACLKKLQKSHGEVEAQQVTRTMLLERRLQDAGKLFEQNELLTVERNALKAALTEERMLNKKRQR
jgi:hypothetical protein